MFDWLIVGAGFAGSVLAERLARGRGAKVLVIDKRSHIGGNAYDYHNDAGLLIHKYGPHVFHTNSRLVFDYLSRFTEWRPYEHRVLAKVDGMELPIPINLDTINRLYNLQLTSAELADWFKARAERVDEVRTAEDVVVSTIGRELYEKFYRHYTRKQWGLDPSRLDRLVTARIPTRTNRDDRYFTDRYQFMPARGYTRMFENMLSHPNIEVVTDVDYRDVRQRVPHARLIYTGAIDEFYDYRYGPLPYRSLRFEHVVLDMARYQSVAVVNFPQTEAYTRVTEHKHLTGQVHAKTALTFEHPSAFGDPYYPVPTVENQALYRKYEALAAQETNVLFAGRLGTYRYYNMDQVVGQALALYRKLSQAGTFRVSHAARISLP